jgi:hypothetical protein
MTITPNTTPGISKSKKKNHIYTFKIIKKHEINELAALQKY